MSGFDEELKLRLDELRARDLYRELRRIDSPQSTHIRIGGKTLLNFSSNDYLGLANDLVLKAAAIQAIEEFGAGSGASRLISGGLAPHDELEQTLAQFKGTAAALGFSSGYAATTGTIGALMGKEDIIVLDKLVHASIVDAARLAGAKLRVFAHNDLNELEEILRWAALRPASPAARGRPRTLVVTESVFSMDGDCAPLREIVALKERYGAWLMIDEAHATGLYGLHRRGLAEEMGVSDRVEIQMGTLGKAIGAAGGYVAGSRSLIDYLLNRARSFIFTTAPPPAMAAAATAGIQFIQCDAGAERREMLWSRLAQFHAGAKEIVGLSASATPPASAIVPWLIGDEAAAVHVANSLRAAGIFIPAIRYPTVARGQARLRVTFSAAHSATDVEALLSALRQLALDLPSPDASTTNRPARS